MIGDPEAGASAKKRIGALLDEALGIADDIGGLATAAHVAHVLHLLDATRPIALPPERIVK